MLLQVQSLVPRQWHGKQTPVSLKQGAYLRGVKELQWAVPPWVQS